MTEDEVNAMVTASAWRILHQSWRLPRLNSSGFQFPHRSLPALLRTASAQSQEVQSQIDSQIAGYRNSAAFLDRVAVALEENGAAYQALVTLRETLDDVMRFYYGLMDYTDGVEEAAIGVSEARTEVKAMLGDTGEDTARDTISFASEKNGAVKSVQFVLTIPAIEKPEETVAEQNVVADETFIEKVLHLFQ